MWQIYLCCEIVIFFKFLIIEFNFSCYFSDHNRLNHGGNKTEPVFQASGGGGGGGGVVAVAGGGGKAVAASVTTAVRAQPIPQTVVTASESSPKAKQPITPLPHVADIKALAALRHSAKGAEALAVLVNYLVYTVSEMLAMNIMLANSVLRD